MLSLSWRSGDSHYEAPSGAALGRDNVEDAPAGRCRTNDRVRSEHARACLRQRNPDQPCGEPRLLGGLLEQRLGLLEFIMRIVGWVGLNTSFLPCWSHQLQGIPRRIPFFCASKVAAA